MKLKKEKENNDTNFNLCVCEFFFLTMIVHFIMTLNNGILKLINERGIRILLIVFFFIFIFFLLIIPLKNRRKLLFSY